MFEAEDVESDDIILEFAILDVKLIKTSKPSEYKGFNSNILIQGLKKYKLTIEDQKAILLMLITVYLKEGNNINKVLKKLPKCTVWEELDDAKSYLKIRPRLSKKSNCDTVTLERIASSFPIITLKLMEEIKPARPVSNVVSIKGIPVSMKTLIACSILPNNDLGKKWIKPILVYLWHESKVKKKYLSDKDRESKIFAYVRSVVTTSIVPMNEREDIARSLGWAEPKYDPHYEIAAVEIKTFYPKFNCLSSLIFTK